MLDLIDAKPAVSPRVVTGTVQLKDEQESKHSSNVACRGLSNDAELRESCTDQLE
jgi:hypothetical protein